MTVSRFGKFSRAITQASIIAVADDDLFEAQRAHMKFSLLISSLVTMTPTK
jgi:hypothetical protein